MKPGDLVRYAKPKPEEASARFLVLEWNGDRGFIRLLCDLPIPPVELVRQVDIALVEGDGK